MAITTDLREKFETLVSNPLKSDSCVSGECVSILLETSWVKIMLVRYEMAPKIKTLEIEISLPTCIIEPTYPPTQSDQKAARTFIQNYLRHLKYLLSLQEAGFAIGVLSCEGILSAILRISGEPQENLFETILPP